MVTLTAECQSLTTKHKSTQTESTTLQYIHVETLFRLLILMQETKFKLQKNHPVLELSSEEAEVYCNTA